MSSPNIFFVDFFQNLIFIIDNFQQLSFKQYQFDCMDENQNIGESLLSHQPDPQISKSNIIASSHEMRNIQINGQNCLSSLFFAWLYPFLSYGSKKTVDVNSMPKLPQEMTTLYQFQQINRNFLETQRSERAGFTLIKVISKTYLRPFLKILAFISMYIVMQTFSPFLTALMMRYISNRADYETYYGTILFVSVVLLQLIKSICEAHMSYRFTRLGISLTNNLTLLIYTKSLRFASVADKQFSESDIINYSQVDAERMSSGGFQIAAVLLAPIQIIIGIIMMYYFIGISFLTGIVIMIVMIGLTYLTSKRQVAYNNILLKKKDARMKVTQEMMDIIRYIKINSIQKFFYNKVDEKRMEQIKYNKKKGFADVLSIFIFWLSCPMILSGTFITYILLGNQMSSQVAFTTIMIFTALQYPIRMIPSSISSLIQIFASIKRIEHFLLTKQIQPKKIKTIYDLQANHAIKIQRGNFYLGVQKKDQQDKKDQTDKDKSKKNESQNDLEEKNKQIVKKNQINQQLNINEVYQPQKQDSQSIISQSINEDEKRTQKNKYVHILTDINLSIKRGNLTIVIGDIGSGKSSLLLAMLNQMISSQQSYIQINGSIAYASQKPCIMSCTVKENIIFQSQSNQSKLTKVIHYACLQQDLKILPKGIDTEIGEKGINISGGQKARIGLARALYSQRDILLLDDILSAVDVHVGQFIMKETLLGYLKGKTIIMPTHALKYVQFVDQIIVMKKGKIVRKGHFSDIKNTPQFQQIYTKELKKQEQVEEQLKEQTSADPLVKNIQKKQKKAQKQKIQGPIKVTDKLIESLMLPEDQAVGSVNYQIFKEYIKYNGGYFRFAFLVCLAMLLWVTSNTIASIVMQRWCENPIGQNYDLYIYVALSTCSNIFIFFRAYTLVLSGAKQGQVVHKEMMKSLLYASLGDFFNRIPIGRIINRLTKDLRQLDQVIGFKIGNMLVNFFLLLGDFVICIYGSTPYILIPIAIVAYLSHRIRKFFMKSQIEVARFQKSTNSPIVSGFMSTIGGLTTIRAYRVSQEFKNKQIKHFDINKKVRLTKAGMNSWFSINLTYLSFAINIVAIGFCLLSDNSNASLAGLLMNYALNLSSDIIYFTNGFAEFETKIISLERIYSFMKIQPEAPYLQYCSNWSSTQQGSKQAIKIGAIKFQNLSAKYRMDLPNVLKQVSCQIKAGQKVGIVGRTGAGKTTIINTLLRITQISQGDIFIDGLKIQDYFLKDLRNGITMIDQDPTLIKSTFKQNLDITGRYTDQEIYEILKQCNLYETIVQKGGLSALVSNDSLSAGQKQLLCICRAFLKHSKIVLVDQATANIDVKNDAIIQRVISQKFKNCTVLTIAHRLSTLVNSDKIIVMQSGKIIEFGSPAELQSKEQGFYKQMVLKNAKQFLM